MMTLIKRLRWLLFFSNSERNQVRQGLRSTRIGNERARELLKELG